MWRWRAPPKRPEAPFRRTQSSKLSPPSPAQDDSKSMPGHSPFTAALLRHLTSPGLTLGNLQPTLKDCVCEDTKGKQASGSRVTNVRCFAPGFRYDACPSLQGRTPRQVPNIKSDLGKAGSASCLFPG